MTATGDVVSFEADNGYDTVRFNANCRNGTLNGGAPLSANEAQLLNAACQVAMPASPQAAAWPGYQRQLL